ncbi:hypothetical protein ACFQX4_26845 [Roseomonas sp. GCM10028921]
MPTIPSASAAAHAAGSTTGARNLAGFSSIPLFTGDLEPFGSAVTTDGRTLWAVHRDGDGHETGREIIRGGLRPTFAFTRGGSRALFRSPGRLRPRVVIADGPLPAICLAAFEGHRLASGTSYLAPGRAWTLAASSTLHALLRGAEPKEVVLAFALAPDGSCRSRVEVRGCSVSSTRLGS